MIRERHAVQVPREAAGNPRALITIWGAWLWLMTGANLAAPLYAVYGAQMHFSSFVLTLIFTTYAIVLLPSLMVFGRVSDHLGRRPVMIAGLAASAAGLALFATATSVVELFAARACQGLAVGMISGAATAALVEFDPKRGERRPALLAGLAQAGGSGLGPLIAGALATWAVDPLGLSFWLLIGITAVSALFILRLPEPERRSREPWRIQLPRVPPEIADDFGRVSVTAALAWGSVALYLSIVPSYSATLLNSHNLALLGGVSALALGTSCTAMVLAQRRRQGSSRSAQALGLVLIAVGLGALVAAFPLHSLALLLVGAISTGAGHGVAFLDAQDELNGLAPPQRRGEVTAAFICCIYAVVGGGVVSTGVLDLWLSLAVSVGAVAAVLAVGALCAAAWQLRLKPFPGSQG
jgi:predicted MFS family arabinose efflux permease